MQAKIHWILLYNKYLPILLQEYIKTDWDARVVTLGGQILGAMKRKVITGDFRSNVSIGAETENMELTDLEIEYSLKAAKVVHGNVVGVDFIPSKNREKDPPYFLEVNSSPGFLGIEEATKQSITKVVLEKYMNRELWKASKPHPTLYGDSN